MHHGILKSSARKLNTTEEDGKTLFCSSNSWHGIWLLLLTQYVLTCRLYTAIWFGEFNGRVKVEQYGHFLKESGATFLLFTLLVEFDLPFLITILLFLSLFKINIRWFLLNDLISYYLTATWCNSKIVWSSLLKLQKWLVFCN